MNDDLRILFSKNLNFWLEQRGKTQADLYKFMDVTSATASDWCNAKKIPKSDKLIKISCWLMIELSDLLEDKQLEKPNELNQLIYDLNNDDEFKNAMLKVHKMNEIDRRKVIEYISLLTK